MPQHKFNKAQRFVRDNTPLVAVASGAGVMLLQFSGEPTNPAAALVLGGVFEPADYGTIVRTGGSVTSEAGAAAQVGDILPSDTWNSTSVEKTTAGTLAVDADSGGCPLSGRDGQQAR